MISGSAIVAGIALTGDSTIQVTGTLTSRGKAHDFTFPLQVRLDGALSTRTHFTISYVKWGLKDPSVFVLSVAKEVDIDPTLAGRVIPES